MRILPLSTINDNRTILQEVLRVRKYLEENPCRNVFHIDTDYDENTVAYDLSKVFIPLDFDGDVNGGDVIIFKNAFIAVLDTVSTDYVIIKADTAVSIKGDKGDTGATGATGNGISAIVKTGTSGLVDTYTITFTNGTTSTFTVTNGKDGENGTDGNGIANIAKTGTTGLVDTYTITFTNGNTTTFTVTNGANGQGIPTGGTTGKVLQKVSDADFDTQWATVVGLPVGGTTGQVLKKTGNANYAVDWEDESGGGGSLPDPSEAPAGGVLYADSIDAPTGTIKTGWGKIPILLSKNMLINPDFTVNQRSFTNGVVSADGYTRDRWYFSDRVSNSALSFTAFTNVSTNRQNGQYCAKITEGSLSQFIDHIPLTYGTQGLLLVTCKTNEHSLDDYRNPIKLYKKELLGSETLVNPIDSGYIESVMNNFDQYYAVYSFSNAPYDYIRVMFDGFETNEITLVDPTCHFIKGWDEYIKTALFSSGNGYSAGFSVLNDSYIEEVEKCKYYYERIHATTTNLYHNYATSVEILDGALKRVTSIATSIKVVKKRISPTLTGSGSVGYITTTGAGDGTSATVSYGVTDETVAYIYIRKTNMSSYNAYIPTTVGINMELDAEIYP